MPAYSKVAWFDDTSPGVNATNLNHLETQYDCAIAVLGTSYTFTTPNIGAATGTSLRLSSFNASQVMATDGSKNIVSLATATYPTSTELSYAKGLVSGLQAQLDGKLSI